jgi:predicted DNA-binding protein
MPKLTFSLDDAAVRMLEETAERTHKPKSLIVREAIAQYAAREEALSTDERRRLLGVLKRIREAPATRPVSDVDRELRAIRQSRRSGWSRPVR